MPRILAGTGRFGQVSFHSSAGSFEIINANVKIVVALNAFEFDHRDFGGV